MFTMLDTSMSRVSEDARLIDRVSTGNVVDVESLFPRRSSLWEPIDDYKPVRLDEQQWFNDLPAHKQAAVRRMLDQVMVQEVTVSIQEGGHGDVG